MTPSRPASGSVELSSRLGWFVAPVGLMLGIAGIAIAAFVRRRKVRASHRDAELEAELQELIAEERARLLVRR